MEAPRTTDQSLADAAQTALGTGLPKRLFEIARDEDLGPDRTDLTGELMFSETDTRTAALVARQPCTVSGLAFAPLIVETFTRPIENIDLKLKRKDGDLAAPGDTLLTLTGSARAIVRLERTLLNILSRLSGIATLTAHYVKLANNPAVQICDTRKTTPGLRVLEKYAVLCGRGTQHRMGLHDALLIKDNHLAHLDKDAFTQRIASAAKAARDRGAQFVQVEVDTQDQLKLVLAMTQHTPDMVLLDNMTPDELRACVALRDEHNPSVLLEASGGITERTLPEVAKTGVDRVSIGALTHQAQSIDLGLDTLP